MGQINMGQTAIYHRLENLPNLYDELLTNTEVLATNHPEGIGLFEYQRLQDNLGLFAWLCERISGKQIR